MGDKIKIIQDAVFLFVAKYYTIIGISFFTAFMGGYSKRNLELKWYERLFEFIVKWGVGSGLSILLTSVVDNKTVIIVITSVVTLAGEEIASWIANNASDLLGKVFNAIISVFSNKFGGSKNEDETN